MLTVEQLSFRYPGRTILSDVSFDLRPGTITCLMGGNGSGKTTLFNLITGFLRPDSGSLRYGELELTGRAPFRIARLGIGRTFQDLRLIGKLTVRENILFALTRPSDERLYKALLLPRSKNFALSPSTEARGRTSSRSSTCTAFLADFVLSDVADNLASEISYGQQKLLTIACCVANGADLLLLDEPVASISPKYRERIAERLASLRAGGKTILLIEHQPDFLERIGERFLVLEMGRLHRFDTLAELNATAVAHAALD